MIRCKTCVMPNTRPDHVFVDGECPACINAKNKPSIDWEARDKELDQLLDRFHGECIVPSSGGKDSFAQAFMLKDKGAHVTAVTARTCHLTDIGRKNLDNMAKHFKTVEYVPNMTVRAKLNKLGLQLVGDISWPEHAAIFSTPFRASLDLGIPLIMYGENPQMEYGGMEGSQYAFQMTRRWRSEYGGFLGLRTSDFIGMEGITERDVIDYDLPDICTYDDCKEPHQFFLGAYMPWDSHANAKLAKDNGMIHQLPTPANYWNAENQDNAQTGIHDHFGYLKYGYGRGCTQISVDVRNSLISREDALEWVKVHDGIEPLYYMDVSLEKVLDHIGMGLNEYLKLEQEYYVNHEQCR